MNKAIQQLSGHQHQMTFQEWQIPAKTFLLGEYAALADGGSILLTTTPCFKLSLSQNPGLHGLHPESPAGRWWAREGSLDYGLHWHDPYNGCGGMGASSAQFLGTYLATSYLNDQHPTQAQMLEAYWECAWQGQGLRPSAYDLIAQSLSGCVRINRGEHQCQISPWPFDDLAFVVVHTGNKVATHRHLQDTQLTVNIEPLNQLVHMANQAFELADGSVLAEAINGYYHALLSRDLVHDETQRLIAQFDDQEEILAVKGCGALGADVLLLLITKVNLPVIHSRLQKMNLRCLATHENLSDTPSCWLEVF